MIRIIVGDCREVMRSLPAASVQCARSSGRARCLMLLDRTTDARTPLPGRVLAVVKHLGIHCGAGGQVVLPFWHREAAVPLWRCGLVEIWNRIIPTVGITGPFYGLTDRGRQLAGAILCPRPKNRRTTTAGGNHGENHVPTR